MQEKYVIRVEENEGETITAKLYIVEIDALKQLKTEIFLKAFDAETIQGARAKAEFFLANSTFLNEILPSASSVY